MADKLFEYLEPAVAYILSRKDKEIKNLKTKEVVAAVNKNFIFLYLGFIIDKKRSVKKFILWEKIHRASNILEKDQNITIAELSKRLGFFSIEQFNEAYERYFAIQPGKYQEIRKGINGLKRSTSGTV
jgi:AraC-like DNA-binding protein